MKYSKIMGIDLGSKRIGVAFADSLTKISIPYGSLDVDSETAGLEPVVQLIKAEQIDCAVVGNPLSMDGTARDMSDRAKTFVENLKKRTNLDVVLWDERMTSQQAERLVKKSSKRRRNGDIDAMAATIILDSYLVSKANL